MSRSRRGVAYSTDFVDRVLLFCDAFPEVSERDVATAFGISARSISNWKRLDMSPEGVALRRKLKGAPHRFVNEDGEFVLAGNILYNDLLRLDTSTPAILDMFPILFDYYGPVNKRYLSKVLERNHLSLRSAVAVHGHEISPGAAQKLSSFIQSVRNFNVPPEFIVNIDLTSVYSDARYVKHAGAKGRFRLSPFFFLLLAEDLSINLAKDLVDSFVHEA